MRKISFILIISVLITLFTGCTSQSPAPDLSVGESDTPSLAPGATPSLPEDRQELTEDGKSILYIGAFSSGNFEITEAYSRLEQAVKPFNIRSKDFEARIIDYGDASGSSSLYRLNTEIITGKMPDMLITFGMPAERYASLGLLYDMSDWLDPEEYFTGLLESMRTDGKLYEVSPGITVTGFYGLSSNLESSGEMSLDELYSAWERFNIGDEKAFIAGFTNELLCLLLISSTELQFVDKNSSTCSFNSPEFIKLLEFCKKLPDKTEALNLDPDNSDLEGSSLDISYRKMPDTHYAISVKEGEALLGMLAASRVWGIPYAPHALMTSILDGRDVTFVGIPGASSASVYMEFPVAVSADSPNLDGAREFIDQLWSLNFMNRGVGDLVMLPLKRSTLDRFVRNFIDKFYSLDEDTVLDLDDRFKPYTLANFDAFLKFIDEASLPVHAPLAAYIPPYSRANLSPDAERQAPSPSSFVNPIIAEEIQAFFRGTQDAARTAELIQSRYSVYLEEQRN